MNSQRLILSSLVLICALIYQASGQGYNYPVPSRPLLYPGENDIGGDSYRRGRGRVVFGTAEDNRDSDLILDRGKGSGRVVEEEVVIRRENAPADRVVERVVEEQVVRGGGGSSYGRGHRLSPASYRNLPVTRRIVYVEPPASTVVRRRIIYRRRPSNDVNPVPQSSSSSDSSPGVIRRRVIYRTAATPPPTRIITRYVERSRNSIPSDDEKPVNTYRSRSRSSSSSSSSGSRRRTTTTTERPRGGSQREVVEEVIYDERERESGVTREESLNANTDSGNVDNIQDVRDQANNEVVREETVEERSRNTSEGEISGGGGGGGSIGGSVAADGDAGFGESGASSVTRRRTTYRSDRDRPRSSDRRGSSSNRVSSTNINERLSSTRPRSSERTVITTRTSGSTNRDLANKAYGIGAGNDEAVSGSSQRRKLLETSFRKDVHAPSYNSVPAEENFNVRSNSDRDVNNFRTSSSTIRKSTVSASGSGGRSYSSFDDDGDGSNNVIIRKTTTRFIEKGGSGSSRLGSSPSRDNERSLGSAQVISGGTFAASNNDQVVSRRGGGGSGGVTTRTITTYRTGGKSYSTLGDADNSGSGSTRIYRVTSSTRSGGSGGRGGFSSGRRNFGDAQPAASQTSFSTASFSDRGQLPSNYRQLMTGTPDEVAAATGARYMYTRTGSVCPSGGCVSSSVSSSSRTAATSSFPSFRAPARNIYEHL